MQTARPAYRRDKEIETSSNRRKTCRMFWRSWPGALCLIGLTSAQCRSSQLMLCISKVRRTSITSEARRLWPKARFEKVER
jgi:hypothetical protein